MTSILFISLMNSNYWGGSELHWFSMAKYYCLQQKKVTCLVYDWDDKREKLYELIALGATLIYIPNAGRNKKTFFEKIRYECITKVKQFYFIHFFDFSKFDCVYVNQGGLIEVANNPWKNIYKKLPKYWLVFHSYSKSYITKKNKIKVLENWIKNSNKCFVASKKIEEFIVNDLKITYAFFNTLFNPLSFSIKENITPTAKLENGNYVAIMLAEYSVGIKAQDNIIKAIANSYIKSENVIFKFFGDGKDKKLLKDLVEKYQLEDKVFIMGKTKEVEKELINAHFLIQTTHIDAMPISVLEAMNMSRFCIVSRIGDMPSWIKNDYNGYISDDASEKNIKKTLENCFKNKHKFTDLSANSFNYFKKNYPKNVNEYFNNIISN